MAVGQSFKNMEKHRIISRLDIKGPNLVKGIHLEGLRVMGKPEVFARHYYQNGADELFFQDTVASLYDRNSLHDIISKTAREIFIPLTVGGGLRTIDDIRNVLRAGADKVAINTAAIKNPDFIKKAAQQFGSSTIVVAIEAIKQPGGKYFAYTDNGREETGLEVVEWAKKIEFLGAGEIVITSVDREGTGEGFDLALTQSVAAAVNIPVIAHGGAGKPADVADVINVSKVDAVAIASILHYDFIRELTEIGSYHLEGNTSFLKSGKAYKKIKPCTLQEIKDFLRQEAIPVR